MNPVVNARPPGQDAPLAEADVKRLDKRLISGLAWTAGAKWLTQLASWASLLVLARLLTPSDFGLVSMATVYLGFVTLLSEFGIGTAVVTLRDLTRQQVEQLNSLALLLGIIGFALSWLVAAPFGQFFHAPQLPRVIQVMSLAFLITAFRTVPYAILQQELRFKPISLMEAAQSFAQAVSALIMAWMGMGYWALVLSSLVGSTVSAALLCAARPRSFALPRLESIRGAMTFSWHILVGRLSWYGYSNADFLVAGRVLGQAPLGVYTFAWNLANLPLEKVTSLVTNVTPGFFSAVQADYAALRRYVCHITEGLSLLMFPATIGLALVAKEFVLLVLGRQWEGVVVPLQLLALYGALRSITTLLGQVITVVGEARFGMYVALGALVVLPSAFYIGSRWGAAGIATAWVLAYPFVTAPLYWRIFSKIDLRTAQYLRALRPAAAGSACMAVIVELVKWLLPLTVPMYLRLLVYVAAGAAAYLGILTSFHRQRVGAYLDMFKDLFRNRSAGAHP